LGIQQCSSSRKKANSNAQDSGEGAPRNLRPEVSNREQDGEEEGERGFVLVNDEKEQKEDFVSIEGEEYPIERSRLVYDPRAEYARMGLPGEHFRQTFVNDRYQLAPTYPSLVIVPRNITDEEVKASAQYRSKNRFIAISWKTPNSCQFIARCSQPLAGLWGKSQPEDTKIVNELARITRCGALRTTNQKHVIRICDARPYVNALGNAVAGKGFESQRNYQSADIVFANIENIHVVRQSFKALCSLFTGLAHDQQPQVSNISFWVDRYTVILEKLQKNRGAEIWLGQISLILQCVSDLASWIVGGGSVLVHCSDGWDRTAQLVSLTQILVDPYFRTIRGFCMLVEKDWISFGHQFSARYGNTSADKEQSPVMIQFLDAVFQVMRQNPQAFEFKAEMLGVVAQALYSYEYGTFLANTEKDYAKLKNRSRSLWNTLISETAFMNPGFDPLNSQVLTPRSAVKDLSLFLHFYKRWDKTASESDSVAMSINEDTILDAISSRIDEEEFVML
jgi:myotubularin-related protein 1/2